MSVILKDQYTRNRRRSLSELIRKLILISVIIGVSVVSFNYGKRNAAKNIESMTIQIAELNDRIAQKDEEITASATQTETLKAEYEQLRKTYEEGIPQGDLIPIINLIKGQIEKGMKADRIAAVIKSAQPPQNCTAPETKQFVVSTALYMGPEGSVNFADKVITVTAKGEPGKNPQGQPEARFDEGKEVVVNFKKPGSNPEIKKGILPLHHTMVYGDREYRFTMTAGEQSFINITSDSCDYAE